MATSKLWKQLVADYMYDSEQKDGDLERDCAKCHRKMALVLPTGKDHLYRDPDCPELMKRRKIETGICIPGSFEVTKFVGRKSSGCDPNDRNREGYKPLHIAALNGRADIVKFLLSIGCHSDAKDHHGKTPLHLASGQGHLEVVKYLVAEHYSALKREGEALL